ncbi:MAG: adenosylmethionine--8-amino-7-oxononanoate transaminase [Candidatus Melainabacteria bacterium]|nr:adenosylmethionine--8-amino-7-oxononanoate transaminase [Candidatus Melainabacteria bacterium]
MASSKSPWQIDQDHIWHPYTQHAIADQPLFVKEAKDEFIVVQDENGQELKLIDGISSWWVNIHGHCNDYINEAIKAQLDKHEQVIFAGFTHEAATSLVAKLLPILPKPEPGSGKELTRAFFSDNGSTAVEVAVKMAVQHWHNQGHSERHRIIALKDSYHGDTVGTMSLGGSPGFHQAFKELMFPVHLVDSPSPQIVKPNARLNLAQKTLVKEEAQELAEQRCLEQITVLINHYPNEIAALVIEPLVQASGGMKFHRPEFLQQLRRLTEQAGIFLIADEVFTGFGRTGTNFACEQAGIVPDMICLSKGLTGGYLPMGLTFCNQEIYSAFHSESRDKTFFHGHSYTGNSLSCAAALASLELYQKENRLKDTNFINMVMQQELTELAELEHIKDVRILGAIGVIEFDQSGGYFAELGPKLTQEFLQRHLLLRPLGNVLYFLPPYTITTDSLNYSMQTIKEVVYQYTKELA